MPSRAYALLRLLGIFVTLCLLHYPLLSLPYFWDEAGYYIPAALDFYQSGVLIPQSTLPTGHTPLVMVYLGMVWHVFGFSPVVTRTAMVFVAAAMVAALYALARRVASREIAVWSALLLALSPLFFAQSSLAHLDLAAGLFTVLAVFALLDQRMLMFAVVASLAVLSKETAVVLLPVAWVFAWRSAGARRAVPFLKMCIALTVPLLLLLAWAVYYHHATGYWTGNREYLQYNLYSTLSPARVLLTLLRRLYEVFFGGFNWLLAGGAVLGFWCGRKHASSSPETPIGEPARRRRAFSFLTVGLGAIYLGMLSVVGGAVLPRYLLPIFPPLILAAVILLSRLPSRLAQLICLAAAGCFVSAWFINPPYPFPFEDNLAYADFARVHQQAAKFLTAQPGQPRILTAWPASDELTRPFLGYVRARLRVVPIESFTSHDFQNLPPESFDLLYLYSRKWEPRDNWLIRFPRLRQLQERYFDYRPEIPEEVLMDHYPLKLLQRFERRGQWVRIYAKDQKIK